MLSAVLDSTDTCSAESCSSDSTGSFTVGCTEGAPGVPGGMTSYATYDGLGRTGSLIGIEAFGSVCLDATEGTVEASASAFCSGSNVVYETYDTANCSDVPQTILIDECLDGQSGFSYGILTCAGDRTAAILILPFLGALIKALFF